MEIVNGIIIPLVASIIGGAFTFLGVYMTIKDQEKHNAEVRKRSVCPYLYVVLGEIRWHYVRCAVSDKALKEEEEYTTFLFYFRNSDNGIAIIKRLESESLTYYPEFGGVVDKNTIVELCVRYPDKRATLKNWRLYVSDIYDNEYCYKLRVISGNEIAVDSIEEVKKKKPRS